MFINTIPTIETFQTYRDLELKKQELETKKIPCSTTWLRIKMANLLLNQKKPAELTSWRLQYAF